ncbi:hypothetical protein J8I87_24955 [Paraburkholderia sp. LEh10]|jgi:hypothetical protein|uniref:hypothetical protein n=1 Tax=Paraburkholderia sp. LEh10 TaxID=2821353 RepID=UPI001AE187DC|nr:hypothetical protein [Paraburkholderia sp. LEh10]MBP0592921.1 hypothetical protein [Paraburkholderia sp. LEh10]
MKRRNARQLVRLLSDMRHAADCRALRAAATQRAMELAAAEAAEEEQEKPETAREGIRDKVTWRTS